MNMRRLNANGLRRFEEFLVSIGGDGALPTPTEVLVDPALSEEVFGLEIEQRDFATRRELGEYLLKQLGDDIFKYDDDRGLWSWLALFYFDRICPTKNGSRQPGEKARWILDPLNYKRYYRHLIAGPFRIARQYRDEMDVAAVVLVTPPGRPGEVAEQLASNQELITSASVLRVAGKLYLSDDMAGLRKGHARKRAGGARRLVKVLKQLDLVWELATVPEDRLVALLPSEFDEFKMRSAQEPRAKGRRGRANGASSK